MSLIRYLNDLDSSRFHQLCFHILKAKYPNAGIKQVEGSGGDRGLDMFSGILTEGPVIWQCKRFEKLRKSQKEQIRKSLNTALKNYQPQRWVLCVSMEFTARNHEWFQALQKEFVDRTAIDLFHAPDISDELIRRRSIQDEFFPSLQLDPGKIKALMTKSQQLTTSEVANVAEENVDQLRRRLEEKDARLTFGVSFPPESTLPSEEHIMGRVPPVGLVMSVSDGTKVIDMYARDPVALNQDPPTVTVRAKGLAAEKLSEAIRLGSYQEIDTVDILELPAPVAELTSPGPIQGCKLVIGPSPSMGRKVTLRATFASGIDRIVYDSMEFRIVRQGTEEVEMESVEEEVPFDLPPSCVPIIM